MPQSGTLLRSGAVPQNGTLLHSGKVNGSREPFFRPIFTKFGTEVYYHMEMTIGVDGMGFLYGLTILFVCLFVFVYRCLKWPYVASSKPHFHLP